MDYQTGQWQVALISPEGEILANALSTPSYSVAIAAANYLNTGRTTTDSQWVPKRIDAMTYIDRAAGFPARAITQVFEDIADIMGTADDDADDDVIL